MKISGLNSVELNDNNEWMNDVAVDQEVEILNIKDKPDKEGFPTVQVLYRILSIENKGKLYLQSYWVKDPIKNKDNGDIIKKGTKWKIAKLAISCNEFKWSMGEDGKWHHRFNDPFDTNCLIGKKLKCDFLKDNEDDEYCSLNNERSIKEKEKPTEVIERKIDCNKNNNPPF